MNNNFSIALAFAAGVALTWWIEGLRWDTDVATLKESHTSEMKKLSDQAVIDLTDQKKRTEAAQTALALLDAQHTKELADEQAKNERLRADVAAGTRRVRISAANLASCQRDGDSTAAASSVGNAATPTITADAERDYWRLRTGIETASRQVKYLQEYINNVCLK